jgi:hypothetical protein
MADADRILKALRMFAREECGRQKRRQRIPGFTCPIIDDAKSLMCDAYASLDAVLKRNRPRSEEAVLARKGKRALEKALRKIEKVREANSDLRTVGYGWHDTCRSITGEIDRLLVVAEGEQNGRACALHQGYGEGYEAPSDSEGAP